jgi:hypothetical protein
MYVMRVCRTMGWAQRGIHTHVFYYIDTGAVTYPNALSELMPLTPHIEHVENHFLFGCQSLCLHDIDVNL